jgi:hypothetical protein
VLIERAKEVDGEDEAARKAARRMRCLGFGLEDAQLVEEIWWKTYMIADCVRTGRGWNSRCLVWGELMVLPKYFSDFELFATWSLTSARAKLL